MSNEPLRKTVKVRIQRRVQRELKRIADERHLAVSDIAREAFREYLSRSNHTTTQEGKAA
jgi:predicted transcriptional regulator